ncbi:MAG: class I SAM-dependent methyltransferase [Promethearchaeota archaeon]
MDIREVKKKLGGQFSFMFDFINSIVKDLELNKDAKILDVGTGQGRMAIILALNDYKVITGEPEGDDPEYAQKNWLTNAKKVNVDHLITFKYFEAENLPFGDNFFDGIFSMGALHHMGDKVAAFSEFSRILKSNGTISIFEPSSQVIEVIRKEHPSHPDAEDPRDYTQTLPLSVVIKNNPAFNAFIFTKDQ